MIKKGTIAISIIISLFILYGCEEPSMVIGTTMITLSNETPHPIKEVYLRSQTDQEWGTNLINEPLNVGDVYKIRDLEKKIVEVKLIMKNDLLVQVKDIDLSEVENYNLKIKI